MQIKSYIMYALSNFIVQCVTLSACAPRLKLILATDAPRTTRPHNDGHIRAKMPASDTLELFLMNEWPSCLIKNSVFSDQSSVFVCLIKVLCSIKANFKIVYFKTKVNVL